MQATAEVHPCKDTLRNAFSLKKALASLKLSDSTCNSFPSAAADQGDLRIADPNATWLLRREPEPGTAVRRQHWRPVNGTENPEAKADENCVGESP